MFVNASRCCRELNKNSLSLLNFRKEGIAKRCKETSTVLQFLSQQFAYGTPIHCYSQLSDPRSTFLKTKVL